MPDRKPLAPPRRRLDRGHPDGRMDLAGQPPILRPPLVIGRRRRSGLTPERRGLARVELLPRVTYPQWSLQRLSCTARCVATLLPRFGPFAVGALVLGGVALAPIVAPVLRAATLASLMPGPIQPVADRSGWPPLIATLGRAYRALPPADRPRATILAGNYGEAGAVDLLGRTVWVRAGPRMPWPAAWPRL